MMDQIELHNLDEDELLDLLITIERTRDQAESMLLARLADRSVELTALRLTAQHAIKD